MVFFHHFTVAGAHTSNACRETDGSTHIHDLVGELRSERWIERGDDVGYDVDIKPALVTIIAENLHNSGESAKSVGMKRIEKLAPKGEVIPGIPAIRN